MQTMLSPDQIIRATEDWLEKAVIGLNLCPFAKSVHVKRQIRYTVSSARDVETLHQDLIAEILLLDSSNPEAIDTTLLIHPWVLNDFLAYNDFLDIAETTVAELGLEGEIQIASFHPDYQFADTEPEDISNYTNRAPFPVLHLLRESSIARAVEAFPDASEIFDRNITTMRRLGLEGWKGLFIEDPSISTATQNKKSNRT